MNFGLDSYSWLVNAWAWYAFRQMSARVSDFASEWAVIF